eukprot:scaffold24312_cov114-Isochrysis_galbana.AAC.2
MPLMIRGQKKGTIRFGLVTATKAPAAAGQESPWPSIDQMSTMSQHPVVKSKSTGSIFGRRAPEVTLPSPRLCETSLHPSARFQVTAGWASDHWGAAGRIDSAAVPEGGTYDII